MSALFRMSAYDFPPPGVYYIQNSEDTNYSVNIRGNRQFVLQYVDRSEGTCVITGYGDQFEYSLSVAVARQDEPVAFTKSLREWKLTMVTPGYYTIGQSAEGINFVWDLNKSDDCQLVMNPENKEESQIWTFTIPTSPTPTLVGEDSVEFKCHAVCQLMRGNCYHVTLARDYCTSAESAPLRLSEEVGCAQNFDRMKVNLNKFKHIWPRSLYNMIQLLSWGGSAPRTGVRRLPQV
ncbi:hypothetical protein M405DRAFT_935421 [Rhizopogon salebrosus TDB-379]|nr:hypothetical protein M405DRAFT_935421 [Rhizopogon salebrosus TDB-379]